MSLCIDVKIDHHKAKGLARGCNTGTWKPWRRSYQVPVRRIVVVSFCGMVEFMIYGNSYLLFSSVDMLRLEKL